MINDKLCLLICLADNCWNDSAEVPSCTGELYQPVLRADVDTWREICDAAIENGFDSILLDIANGIKFKTHPEIAVDGAWTPEFMNSEVKRYKEKGLKIYPRLNFSAGHDAWLEEYSRMVSTGKYYEVARDLIHEVCDIFDTPEIFSLVLDEENGLNQGRLRYACYRQFDLIWHDVNYLCDCVREKGVRPCMGADYYWSYPEEFLANVPKDVLICPWYYLNLYFDEAHPRPTHPWSVNRLECFEVLTKAGYDIMLQPSANENNYNVEHTIRFAREKLDENKINGVLMCGSWAAPMEGSKYYYLDAIYQARYSIDKMMGGK